MQRLLSPSLRLQRVASPILELLLTFSALLGFVNAQLIIGVDAPGEESAAAAADAAAMAETTAAAEQEMLKAMLGSSS